MSRSSKRKRNRSRRRSGATGGPPPQASGSRSRSPEARELDRMIRRLTDRVREAHDPATSPERAAEILLEDFEASPAPPGFVQNLAQRTSVKHVKAVVAATIAQAPGSITALTAEAEVARTLDDDPDRARELVQSTLSAELDPDGSAFMAEHLLAVGLRAEALGVLQRRLRVEPEDEEAHGLFARLIEDLHGARLAGAELHRSERQALEHFDDRALLYRLRDALAALVERQPELTRLIATTVRDWLEDASTSDPDGSYALGGDEDEESAAPDERVEGIIRMAVERAWLRSSEELDEDEEEWDDDLELDDLDLDELELAPDEIDLDDIGLIPGEEEDEDPDVEWERSATPLALLARDPATAPELARAARSWYESSTYGLWLLADPTSSPGVWLTEILTGARRYVALAPEQRQDLRRWSVMLGPLVAIDGIWRSTGAFVALTPAEGDQAAAFALDAVEDMLRELSGRRARGPSRKRRPEPHGVLVEASEPANPVYRALAANMVSQLLPTIAGGIWGSRRAGPRFTNMEGHPVKLITARIAVADEDALMQRLAAHPDFRHEDEDELSWWGRELTAHERESALASVRAQLSAEGGEAEVGNFDERPRWLRGRVRRPGEGERGLELEVNSEERLDALLALLRELGERPKLRRRSAVDPAQDMAPLGPLGPIPFGDSPEAVEIWQRHWPDQPTPALDGLTPRAASRRKAKRAQLEAVLRTLEHDADGLRADGRPVPDLGAVRAQLGIERYSG
jgi:hypothetical protein